MYSDVAYFHIFQGIIKSNVICTTIINEGIISNGIWLFFTLKVLKVCTKRCCQYIFYVLYFLGTCIKFHNFFLLQNDTIIMLFSLSMENVGYYVIPTMIKNWNRTTLYINSLRGSSEKVMSKSIIGCTIFSLNIKLYECVGVCLYNEQRLIWGKATNCLEIRNHVL